MRIKCKDKKCSGCSACQNICPTKSIQMKADAEGLLYPNINEETCTNCGLCGQVCPIFKREFNAEPLKVIAFAAPDNIRLHSTSGGFFTCISDHILNIEGVVYGAVFDENFYVHHIRALSTSERDKMRHSKYVQSEMGSVFVQVGNDLKQCKTVLFTGTPCQVAGLKNYLKHKRIDDTHLVTCDIICHGTPSPLVWHDYLNFIESKYSDTIEDVNFRDKSIGWHKPQLKITMSNHVQAKTESQEAFYHLFYSNCILRPSCHTCFYTHTQRVSDITMADCWGVEDSHPQWDDNKGLSLLLINTRKGVGIIDKMGLTYNEIKIDDIRQPHLNHPAMVSMKREKFWYDYENKGFKYILNEYGNYSIKSKVVRIAKKMVLKVIGR